MFGEDVGYFGGVFRCTEGLQAQFGASRVLRRADRRGRHRRRRDRHGAPTACGRCVEIQFADYIYPGLRPDRVRGGAAPVPLGAASSPRRSTVRMPCGGGIYGGQTHSQSPEALFTHVCGLKTVCRPNPYDAKGLLIAAIEDDDPVIFLEPKRHLQRTVRRSPRPADRAVVEAPARRGARGLLHGAARSARDRAPRGQRRSRCSPTARWCTSPRPRPSETGIDAEIIDLRTLLPLDIDTIVASVKKTGRCVIVHEATRTCGFGAELSGTRAGALLLSPRGADRARHRLGHAVSARARVDVLPRARPRRRGVPRVMEA